MRGFSLHLGDGSRWWIAGLREAAFMAEKVAAIMQVKEGDPGESRLILFYEKHHWPIKLPFSQDQGWIRLYPFNYHIYLHNNLHHVICECDTANPHQSPYALMSAAIRAIHWESIGRGGLPCHAALLERHGQAVILAAPGGTGKSTCGRRTVSPWQARSDDEALLVLAPGGRYLAHPFPTWTDYIWERGETTWNVERAAPLAGIFFLVQSPQDDFIPLKPSQAALAITNAAEQIMTLKGLCGPHSAAVRELRRQMFTNACEIVKHIPAFRLKVSLTGTFWEKIEAALGWR